MENAYIVGCSNQDGNGQVVLNTPSGAALGDVAIAFICTDAGDVIGSVPEGWELLSSFVIGKESPANVYVYLFQFGEAGIFETYSWGVRLKTAWVGFLLVVSNVGSPIISFHSTQENGNVGQGSSSGSSSTNLFAFIASTTDKSFVSDFTEDYSNGDYSKVAEYGKDDLSTTYAFLAVCPFNDFPYYGEFYPTIESGCEVYSEFVIAISDPIPPATYLIISPTSIGASACGGGYGVYVSCDGTWSAVSNNSWITLPSSTSTIQSISIAANSGAARSGSVTFSCPGLSNVTLTVNQAAVSSTSIVAMNIVSIS